MEIEKYRYMFRALPISCMILDPEFNIKEATDLYLKLSHRNRDNITDRNYFEVFEEEHFDDEHASDIIEIVEKSLIKVRDQKKVDHLPIARYDIPNEAGVITPHFWTSWSVPMLDVDGELLYILHRLEDVTPYVGVVSSIKSMGDNLYELSDLLSRMLNRSI